MDVMLKDPPVSLSTNWGELVNLLLLIAFDATATEWFLEKEIFGYVSGAVSA
jgi:hypothetical protein